MMSQEQNAQCSSLIDNFILTPLSRNTFFRDYWEKSSIQIERDNPAHFQGLITTSLIKTLVKSAQLRYPNLTLAHAGTAINVEDYADTQGKVDVEHAFQLYEAGATIIVSQAHNPIPTLAELVDKLTVQTQYRWQANVYLTPAGNQGFEPHYDTHDVFILQVEGEKTFRFFTSDLKLPFTDDAYDKSLNAHAQLCDEVTLRAGDTLYIPRGNVHDAKSVGADPSLHVTLGCYATNQRDLLQCFIQVAAEQLDSLRHSIPSNIWLEPDSNKALPELVLARFNDVCKHADAALWMEEAIDRLKDEFALSLSTPENSGSALHALAESEALSSPLTMDTRMRIVETKVLSVQSSADYCRVRCPGRLLEFEYPLCVAVKQLLKGGSFRLNELDSLSEMQALALARQLFSESMVELVS